MDPSTNEYLEAKQEKANIDRQEFLKSVSSDERAKHETIDKVIKMMTEADIPFFLFPCIVSNLNKKKIGAWGWNSLWKYVTFDKYDRLTKESVHKIELFTSVMMHSLFLMIISSRPEKSEIFEDNFDYFMQQALSLIISYRKYFYDKTNEKE